jgi:hypothetical protein
MPGSHRSVDGRAIPSQDVLPAAVSASSRWLARLGGVVFALLVYWAWQAAETRFGLGLASAIVRIVVVTGIVVWVWRATRRLDAGVVSEDAATASPVPSSSPAPRAAASVAGSLAEDPFSAHALHELTSGRRNAALWARCMAEAQSNEALAEMHYLRERAKQLSDEHREEELRSRKAMEDAHRSQAMRIVEGLPKGTCPTCQAAILLSAQECPNCSTSFRPGSGHTILPLRAASSRPPE